LRGLADSIVAGDGDRHPELAASSGFAVGALEL
jgi:hypothetical protein